MIHMFYLAQRPHVEICGFYIDEFDRIDVMSQTWIDDLVGIHFFMQKINLDAVDCHRMRDIGVCSLPIWYLA